MRDKELCATILGVLAPGWVRDVALRPAAQEVDVSVGHDGSEGLSCPRCGRARGRHDTRRRSWRHLDTCQFRTTLTEVSRRLRVSWDEFDGIQQRAVRRGLARRAAEPIVRVGVDETSFQRRD